VIHILSSIMQPATATDASSGANQVIDIEMAVRFCLEVAKALGRDECTFYDAEEFDRLVALYGSMKHLQTDELIVRLIHELVELSPAPPDHPSHSLRPPTPANAPGLADSTSPPRAGIPPAGCPEQ